MESLLARGELLICWLGELFYFQARQTGQSVDPRDEALVMPATPWVLGPIIICTWPSLTNVPGSQPRSDSARVRLCSSCREGLVFSGSIFLLHPFAKPGIWSHGFQAFRPNLNFAGTLGRRQQLTGFVSLELGWEPVVFASMDLLFFPLNFVTKMFEPTLWKVESTHTPITNVLP